MPRFFVKKEQVKKTTIEILGEDIKHIKNVLRKQIGEDIEICDKDTKKSYICEIEKIEEKSILTKIIEELQSNDNKIEVDIYQGLPKAEKMELIIQKSVELGANAIIPVEMKRCVVKIASKDEMKKITRWQKIAESAAKQSGRDTIPEIKNIVNVEKIAQLINKYDSVLVAYENEKENTIKQELLKLKQYKKTEQKIEETEAAIAQIDEEFLNPEYATNSAKLGELSKKREELEETLSALYETWETLLA